VDSPRAHILDVIDPQLEDGTRGLIHDSPVLPEVWAEFAQASGSAVQLLIAPARGCGTHEVLTAIRERLARGGGADPGRPADLYYHQSLVLAEMVFADFVSAVLPITEWWQEYIERPLGALKAGQQEGSGLPEELLAALIHPQQPTRQAAFSSDLLYLIRAAAIIVHLDRSGSLPPQLDVAFWRQAVTDILAQLPPATGEPEITQVRIDTIGVNRKASRAIFQSTRTIKADAALRVFEISCDRLRWAVVDSGNDATHPAFQRRATTSSASNGAANSFASRVIATFDFTRLQGVLKDAQRAAPDSKLRDIDGRALDRLRWQLARGQVFDWSLVKPFLSVPHDDGYVPPSDEHGSHVAGILAADWRKSDDPSSGPADMCGVCPDLSLYDFRVLSPAGGDEFTIVGALQFIRYLNQTSEVPVIHGVNLSFSLPHEVRSYACGRSPICDECERLVDSGVVVVAAAGNSGHTRSSVRELLDDYHGISITDPGNADGVITVGSTHRESPQTHGISYFSSRGPTADGRPKPDLVAPGEGIESTVPFSNSKRMNGTSMAAPHVSGAAALLLAHNPNLVGHPRRVKDILCRSATDLGRERSFQGAGLVDVLRALRST
jgi:serine protease AprX